MVPSRLHVLPTPFSLVFAGLCHQASATFVAKRGNAGHRPALRFVILDAGAPAKKMRLCFQTLCGTGSSRESQDDAPTIGSTFRYRAVAAAGATPDASEGGGPLSQKESYVCNPCGDLTARSFWRNAVVAPRIPYHLFQKK